MKNKNIILNDIIGTSDLSSEKIKMKLMFEMNDIETRFTEYEKYFEDEPTILDDILECHKFILNLYGVLIKDEIKMFSYNVFGNSIDFVLLNYSQKEIKIKFNEYMQKKGMSEQFICDVFNQIIILGERLNKRFSFDEMSLINLIEASSGKNIIVQEGNNIRPQNRNEIVLIRNGKYKYKTLSRKDIYSHDGTTILNPIGKEQKEEKDIRMSSFPLGYYYSSTDAAMQKIIRILFENINLCLETYNSVYCSGNNIVENTATLSDGSKFDFKYIINERNIPHLLGFQRGETLNTKTIEILKHIVIKNQKPRRKDGSLIIINERSSAMDILNVICANENDIISLGGLYEENGVKYEILNWEKIILKTSSFMRGDFFKKCFCLVKLAENKYLCDPAERGGYISIASTEYNGKITKVKSTKDVFNDLFQNQKIIRDFIFR